MHDSNTNTRLFLKAFLLLLVVFFLSASADFKKQDEHKTKAKIESCSELRQQNNAVLVSIPKLPPLNVKWSFGGENNFLFRKPDFASILFSERKNTTRYKSIRRNYLGLKEKFEEQAFLTTMYSQKRLPLSLSA